MTCFNKVSYINTELCYDLASIHQEPVIDTTRTQTEPKTKSLSSGNTSTSTQAAPMPFSVPAVQLGGDTEDQSDTTAATVSSHEAIPVYDYPSFQSQDLHPSERESMTTLKEKIELQPNTSYRLVGTKI